MCDKLTGKIGVCFGSAGPGAVHLLNGLYDAKEDGIPMLAIVAQVPTKRMNMDFFQAMNEEPIFDDVAVWNRTAMTAESLPMMTDEAIRQAYAHNGVAVLRTLVGLKLKTTLKRTLACTLLTILHQPLNQLLMRLN